MPECAFALAAKACTQVREAQLEQWNYAGRLYQSKALPKLSQRVKLNFV